VEEGVARKPLTYEEELTQASGLIRRAREQTRVMMAEGLIPSAA
jgi:hypothetical protein